MTQQLNQDRLAAHEQEPVVSDDMALAFHHALSDGAIGSDDIEDIKTGLRAALANFTHPAPSIPNVIIRSSAGLHDFYRAYSNWLTSGGNGDFSCSEGLCAGLFDYCQRLNIDRNPLLEELHAQFVAGGLNEKLPFNLSKEDFDAESAGGKCHINTKRRGWVYGRLADVIDNPAPSIPAAVPDAISTRQAIEKMEDLECGVSINVAYKFGWNACRAAMLQSGTLIGEGTIQIDGWIPVSERLPSQHEPLLICSSDGVVQLTVYGFDGENWLDWYEQHDPVKAELSDLWQPLPAAPKGV